MKIQISLSLILLLAAAAATADVPTKKNVNSYSRLWTDSPFTSKPLPPPPPEEVSQFEDWALGGVSEVEGGYMVTLLHKKNAGDTQVIRPTGTVVSTGDEMEWIEPGASGSFTVNKVEYGKDSWKNTKVILSSGGKVGSVEFDEKLITPSASAAPPPQQAPGQAAPATPGGATPVLPPGVRPPRQRVIPPVPNQNSNQDSNRSERRPSRGR